MSRCLPCEAAARARARGKKSGWVRPALAFAVVIVALEMIAKTLKGAQPAPRPAPNPSRGQQFVTLGISGPGQQPGVTIGQNNVLTVTTPGNITATMSSDDSVAFAEPQIGGSTDFVAQKPGTVTATIEYTDGAGTAQTVWLPIEVSGAIA